MSLIDRLSEWSGKIVSYLVLVMMLILIYEIAVRSILGKPTLWGYELAGMLFGAFCVIAGAYTHRYEAHVRMDVIYSTWGPRTRAIADTCTSFLLLLFLLVFLWLSIQNASFTCCSKWNDFRKRGNSPRGWSDRPSTLT